MPKRRPSRGSAEGTLEGRTLSRFPYYAFTQFPLPPKYFDGRLEHCQDVPEENVAVHGKRHCIHELCRVGHEGEQRDSEELFVDT